MILSKIKLFKLAQSQMLYKHFQASVLYNGKVYCKYSLFYELQLEVEILITPLFFLLYGVLMPRRQTV